MEIEIKSTEIKIVPIEEIIPNPDNTNRHPVEQLERLAKIYQYQGFRTPLVVSNRSGFLIAGHARLEVAKTLGMKELPVIFEEFENEAQEYAHLNADNELARWAELDRHLVHTKLETLDLDVEMLGIEKFDFEKLDEYETPDNKEIDLENFGNDLQHTCPKCGFEFND